MAVDLAGGQEQVDQVDLGPGTASIRARVRHQGTDGVLKERWGGAAADPGRKHGISDVTFYGWRSKHGDMEVFRAKRLSAFADENARLKKLLGESRLDISRWPPQGNQHRRRCLCSIRSPGSAAPKR